MADKKSSRTMTHGSQGLTKPKTGGIDVGKFASEVSGNFAKGADHVGKELNKALPSREASKSVGGAMKNAPANRAAIRKALGK